MNDFIEGVMAYLEGSSLTDDFIEAVYLRLVSFGYTPTSADYWTAAFCCQKVENHIRNVCNIKTVPEGLYNIAVDRVCGEFLNGLKATGKLNIEGLDLSAAVTSIKEGDTQVSFASGGSTAEQFSAFVSYMMSEGEGELICYRKLRW